MYICTIDISTKYFVAWQSTGNQVKPFNGNTQKFYVADRNVWLSNTKATQYCFHRNNGYMNAEQCTIICTLHHLPFLPASSYIMKCLREGDIARLPELKCSVPQSKE
jgi:hypothetical protein